jgi:hypothetical protein
MILLPIMTIQTCNAEPTDIQAYEQQLQSVSSILTNHDYYSNYSASCSGRESDHSICSFYATDKKAELSKNLKAIQTGNFEFLSPSYIPASGQELLWDVESLSHCENLAFMNVETIRTDKGVNPVPWRPSEGFGIYELPIKGKKILLVR